MDIAVESFVNRGGALPWALEGQALLRVSVRDRGIGIRDEDRERIFEEFEQADPSMSRNYQGTGLGLALTKRLVDLHGGRVGVTSVYGEGSEFFFYLPAGESGQKMEGEAEEEPLPASYPWSGRKAPGCSLLKTTCRPPRY